jgi:cubilin
MSCVYQFNPTSQPAGTYFYATFNTFQTERSFDYLYVYEGSSANRYMGILTGSSLTTPFTVYSGNVNNGMYMSWRSDGSINYQGFSGTYGYTTNPCGNTQITGTGGVISSPNYPNLYYPRGLNCQWTITAPSGYSIWLSFSAGSTYPGLDYVTITTPKDGLLGRFSGTGFSPVNTTGNTMNITFTSSTSNAGSYAGWKAQWYAYAQNTTTGACACQPYYFGFQGTITSPNYPNGYCNNLNCVSVIIVPSGMASLTINRLNTEASFDTLTVYDNPNIQTASLLGVYSGSLTAPITLYSGGNGMALVFNTDASLTDSGWTATYQSVSSICGNNAIVGSSGSIASPNYPAGNYPDNSNCQWIITVDENDFITIAFVAAQTRTNDVVTLYDGSGKLITTLQGNFNGTTVNSTSNVLEVTFTSDTSGTASGWLAQWQAFNPTPPCGCGRLTRTVTTASGSDYLASPNYPTPYCSQEDCTWYLVVPQGYGMLITFETFDIELGYDFLAIFDGYYSPTNTSSANLVATCSGLVACKPPALSQNIATITFNSDYSNNGQGFNLTFTPVSSSDEE